ncbi:MAG: carboxypeptidase M32 [Acidimicrobiales bacterium]|jgi:carboxypeptidase Taq|nr:carboxypeptidase M32 [Acidimicrobiales bacterium]
MSTEPTDPTQAFLDRWADIAALERASAVLGWDQETCMPPAGQASRGRTLSALAGLHHEKLTDPSLAELVEQAGAVAERGSAAHAQVREAQRCIRRATAVPGELARRVAETQSRSLASWQQARRDDDFSVFAPDLTEMVSLTREVADALVAAGVAARPYDALLDDYEPGMTEQDVAPVLASLRDRLSPLVQAVADSGVVVDEGVAHGTFPGPAQEAFAREVAVALGYDFAAGRLDESAHPFSTGFGPGDVRITWRWLDDDFRSGLFGVMHETGHALYEQGLPAAWDGTPIGGAVSLGVHESQSRLFENLVGRSRGFWEWALPRFHEAFPASGDVSPDALWPALHTTRPSLVRVEADEATYNLHIVARFEIERRLFAGDVDVHELPELWDATYDELLGVHAPTPADGVLQDIHWSMGAFGYFPTYTLGNLLSAQLFAAAERDLGQLEPQFARGEFGPLLGWLRTHVHEHASRYPAPELIERATGAPLAADDWLAYITRTVADVYGVTV